MGLFDKMKEPIFLKETSDAQAQLDRLRALEPLLNPTGQAIIRQDIKNLESGIFGEGTIAFELKNSHMPLYILHDIYLDDGELSAQIDYLVFTRKMCFVIECKNLFGDIEINSAGDFIRTTEFYGKKKREGIYSPITQNQRHLELMKKIKLDNRKNAISRFMTEKYFELFNKSIVVLANPKTILNAKFAKKDIKEKVIRADQLVKYIKDNYIQSKEEESNDSHLLEWAQSYLLLHKQVEKDYTDKYQQYLLPKASVHIVEHFEQAIPVIIKEPAATNNANTDMKVNAAVFCLEETEIFKDLRAYRLTRSRAENIKPYFIYNDMQLKDLIEKRPKTLAELQTVAGFGEAKVKKYGEDILKIVSKYIY